MIAIDKGVKLPRAKASVEHERVVSSACRAYRNAYEAVYVRSPDIVVKDNGFISVDGAAGVDVKRLKQLTAQLENRRQQQ